MTDSSVFYKHSYSYCEAAALFELEAAPRLSIAVITVVVGGVVVVVVVVIVVVTLW